MANVEDLLRKQKGRIEKIGSSPAPRKKIVRKGPTRPWQENLPQYQDAEPASSSQTRPYVESKKSQEVLPEKDQASEFTELQSTSFQSTQVPKQAITPAVAAQIRNTENRSTEIQLPEIRSTEIKSTESWLTENKSTKSQLSGTRPTELQTTDFQSTQTQYTGYQSPKTQSTAVQSTKRGRVGESLEPLARTTGYFQLNYSALELMRRLEAGEFVVFHFLTLKAWGWDPEKHRLGNGLMRAAGTYVSQSLGIAKSSADKYLGNLVEKGLLTLVEKSHKHGNTYRVDPALTMNGVLTESRSTEMQSTGGMEANQLVDRQMDTSSLKDSQLVDRDSVKLVDTKSEDRRSLSVDRPLAWADFVLQLTEKGRERAERVFQSLKTQFPDDPIDELAECPRNLERYGAPDGTPWARISSPIGLMESSWPQLRDFFRKCIAESKKANQAWQQVEADRVKAEENARQEAEESRRRREAFYLAHPDEQQRRGVIQRYLAGLPFNPDGQVGQGIAIGKWWDETRPNAGTTE